MTGCLEGEGKRCLQAWSQSQPALLRGGPSARYAPVHPRGYCVAKKQLPAAMPSEGWRARTDRCPCSNTSPAPEKQLERPDYALKGECKLKPLTEYRDTSSSATDRNLCLHTKPMLSCIIPQNAVKIVSPSSMGHKVIPVHVTHISASR